MAALAGRGLRAGLVARPRSTGADELVAKPYRPDAQSSIRGPTVGDHGLPGWLAGLPGYGRRLPRHRPRPADLCLLSTPPHYRRSKGCMISPTTCANQASSGCSTCPLTGQVYYTPCAVSHRGDRDRRRTLLCGAAVLRPVLVCGSGRLLRSGARAHMLGSCSHAAANPADMRRPMAAALLRADPSA